jgi:peroxiredoxin
MAIQIGQQAPDFSLYNTQKEKINLSELKGQNVVILFFPLAFTSVCTAELCSVRDNLARYDALDAKVLGISVDSPYTLARFKEDQKLNFELLSDFNKEAATAYDALYPQFAYEMRGVSKRAAFVVDKEGTIRYAEVLENAGLQPNFTAIEQALEQCSLTV